MVFKRLRVYGQLVMFEHTLFAMPFALAAVFMASSGVPRIDKLFWVILAMVGARNGANALNRLIDADIDSKNLRTATRHIPTGIVKKKEAFILTVICFIIFVFSAYMLNIICVILLPIPLAMFIAYSFTKRFTWLCHLILGITIGGAPVGAWLAVTGKLDFSLLPSFLMGGALALWIAGFDIIYSTQDVEFDHENHLHSIPITFGISKSLKISTLLHIVSVILLVLMPLFIKLGIIYYIGIIIISALLYYEHSIVSPDHLASVKIASYSINQIIGFVFLIFTVSDIIVRSML